MECKHAYYQYVKGELVCVQCGKPAEKNQSIEDKIDACPEDKIAERPEVKRIVPRGIAKVKRR